MARAKSSRLRILQVVHGFAPDCRGGTENYVLEASIALRTLGADIAVLAGSPDPREPAQLVTGAIEGIPVTRLHRSGLFLDNWEKSYDPAAGLLFERVLDEARPDVVHVHHWIRLTRNLVEIAATKGIPAVVTLHDAAVSCPRVFRVREETLCHRPLSVESCLTCVPRRSWLSDPECGEEIEAYRGDFARELDLASAVIVPSGAHREFLSRELRRPASFFRVLPHGKLARERPQRPDARRKDGRVRLAHWGHLEPYKGYHVLLEALRLLKPAERRRFEVVCFGVASDPEYRRRLDELSEGLPVTEKGAFAPKDLGSDPFDVAVIPSLASESFSFVLDEAFELGVPALVAARGALEERLGGAGATFQPESAADLAARLREILADPTLLDRWRAAIPALIPMEDHARKLLSIYRGAIRHGREAVVADPAVASTRLARVAHRLEERTQALDHASALAAQRAEELARKDADLDQFQRSIEDHQRSLENKDATVAEHAQALAAKTGEARVLASEVGKKDAVIAGFERSVAEHARALAAKTGEARVLASEVGKKDAVIAGFERSVAQHRAEIERQTRDLSEFQRSTAALSAEVARLEADARSRLAERAAAESTWRRSLEEHERSLRLHEDALAAREAESAEARGRYEAFAAAFATTEKKVERAKLEARSLAVEISELHARTQGAEEARARADADAEALDAARAEEQREVAAWRDRAVRSEAAMTGVEAAKAATTAALAALRRDLQDLQQRTERIEDDARRVDDLASRGAAALALPPREDGDRVARASDLVGAVLEQQARIGELRSWLRTRNGTGGAAEALRRLDTLPRRLRVLLVIHDFLPYHAAGSEVYTHQLAKALATRNDVELVFCENRPERPQYEARRGSYDGLPFTEIVHHAAWRSFRATYLDSRMDAAFDAVLDRFRPDVVHVQHTKFFGVGILGRAARRGIPIVYTLHEYMLLCARDGQLLRESLERCDLPETKTCAECMAPKLVESGRVWRGVQRIGRGLAHLLPGALKEVGTRIERRAAVRHGSAVDAGRRVAMIEDRGRVMRAALEHVDLFLAPSEFLRRTFVASGFVPAERIVVSRYGQDLTRFRDARTKRIGPLRVGYLGTVAAYKGVEVLVDALNRLAAYDVEGRIHGVTEFFPDFVRQLEARITNPRVRLLGRYENKDVGRVLSGMDVLVVPSLWWENSPITIHEAFVAGVPVIASDQGGMAELVQDGKNGFLFRIGDAADLARVLLRIVANPELLDAVRPRREAIRDIREDALWTEGQYRRLIADRVAAG